MRAVHGRPVPTAPCCAPWRKCTESFSGGRVQAPCSLFPRAPSSAPQPFPLLSLADLHRPSTGCRPLPSSWAQPREAQKMMVRKAGECGRIVKPCALPVSSTGSVCAPPQQGRLLLGPPHSHLHTGASLPPPSWSLVSPPPGEECVNMATLWL